MLDDQGMYSISVLTLECFLQSIYLQMKGSFVLFARWTTGGILWSTTDGLSLKGTKVH